MSVTAAVGGSDAGARHLVLITHPNVVISADVPVPRWPLSERGRERMRLGLQQPWIAGGHRRAGRVRTAW